MNTKLLHRLAWKELRTLRALWLSLLAMAIFMEFGLAWLTDRPLVRSEWVFTVALFLPVVYSLACAAMSFAGECEEGTDQFLSRLAAPPLPLLGVKLAMILLSTAALLAILYPLAWMLAPWQERWGSWSTQGSLASRRMLALAWGLSLFSWGLFFSLLFRRVLACLVAATVAATLTPLAVFAVLDVLPFRQAKFETLDWSLRLAVIPGLLLMASALLVQTWDENRWPRIVELLLDGWRRLTATRERSAGVARSVENRSGDWRVLVRPFGLCLPDEWLPSWRREARRLLWLEWRQARRVMLFVGLAFGLYLTAQALFVTNGMGLLPKESPFVLALMAFVFGVSSFQAQQSEQRFRGFAGHGVSPVAMWITKQGVWFATVLFVAIVAAWLCRAPEQWFSLHLQSMHEPFAKLGYGIHWAMKDSSYYDPQWYRETPNSLVANAMLSLGLCFAVGQFVSLFIPRSVTAAAVGFVFAGVAFAWQQLTAHLAVPSALAVLPLIVGLLLATFVRIKDWLEGRNSIRSWLNVVTAWLVPSLAVLIAVPLYRVLEIPRIDPDWLPTLKEASKPLSESARQTAAGWISAAESIDGEPSLRSKRRERREGANEEVEVEVTRESADLIDLQLGLATWSNLKNQDWVTRNVQVLAESARLAQEPDCAFRREIFERDSRDSVQGTHTFRSLARLAVLLSMAAQSAMADGRLDESLQHALVLHRFGRHVQQHGGWNATSAGEGLEIISWQLLLDWARHPRQTGESLREALGRSGVASRRPLQDILFPRFEQLIPCSNVVLSDYAAAKADLDRHWREGVWPGKQLISERRREERLLDYSALTMFQRIQSYVAEYAASGDGESRFVQQHSQFEREGLEGFLQSTTRSSGFMWNNIYGLQQRANERGKTELRRRAMIAMLALRGFHLDHGRWPAQWEELVGPYLDRVPVDPWTGQNLELRPQGFPFDVRVEGRWIRANTPLFLSGGWGQQHFVPTARPPIGEETSPQVQWLLVSKFGISNWPGERDDYNLTSIVCFPLTPTEQ